MILPGILEHVAAVGREHELGADTPGCVAKRPRLVARRRREEQDASHDSTDRVVATLEQHTLAFCTR